MDVEQLPLTDREIEQQQADIREAVAQATAHRRSAPGNAQRETERLGPITINGVPHLPAPPPSEFVASIMAQAFHDWRAAPPGQPDLTGEARARFSLELLDKILAYLSARKGGRADVARAYLSHTRNEIAAALAAFDGIGAVTSDLVKRIAEGRASYAAAQNAVHFATRANAAERILAVQVEEAYGRELTREAQAAAASLAFPSLHDAAAFSDAKHSTTDLQALPGKDPAPSLVARAIEEGQRAGAQAKLWIVWETKPHALTEWRWLAHVEAKGT